MQPGEISEGRRRVRDVLGRSVEEKATDEFCVSFSGMLLAHGSGGGGAEALRRSEPTRPATVIELADHEEFVERLLRLSGGPFGSDAWKEVTDVLRRAQSATPDLAVGAERVVRDSRTRSLREQAYKDAGPLHDSLQRVTGGPFRPGPEVSGLAQTPSVITEYCWLNRSIRTWADPSAIADVAADPKVARIDVSHRLEIEVSQTAEVVEATRYRSDAGATGAGVIIGILDSEVATAHPAFGDRVVHRANYTREPWGTPGEHGTAVAGVAGSGDQATPGVAPGVTIYNYKVLATNRFLNGDDFDGALAIQQALEDGVDVANCSWGAGSVSAVKSREANAVDTAWALGLTVVKSAGNEGHLGASSITTPADADGIITVGATDRLGSAVCPYSSLGPVPGGTARPHFVAPGGTKDDPMMSCVVGGGFGPVGHGTSYAAPHVTGLVALLLEARPGLMPDDVRDLLFAACVPFDGVDQNKQGAGLIRASGLPR